MNQILSTEMNKNKNTNSNVIDIKKIIMFFSIVIIVFGMIIAIKSIISAINNAKNNIKVEQTAPEVEMEQGEDEIKLIANHDKPIIKIVYYWNDGQEITINGNNRTSITQTIALPNGTNKLTVKITDEIQSVATIEKTFTKVETEISLSFALIENKIKITATDTKEMDYIMYKWNNEQSKKIELEENTEDRKKIETEIEIPEGLNTLTVIAMNKSGQSKTKTQEIEGIASPKITLQKDGEYIIINAKDENIITLINYTLNNQAYRINFTVHDADYYNAIEGLNVKTNSQGKIIEMEYRQLMTEKGQNIINITVENKKGAQATASGQCSND